MKIQQKFVYMSFKNDPNTWKKSNLLNISPRYRGNLVENYVH